MGMMRRSISYCSKGIRIRVNRPARRSLIAVLGHQTERFIVANEDATVARFLLIDLGSGRPEAFDLAAINQTGRTDDLRPLALNSLNPH